MCCHLSSQELASTCVDLNSVCVAVGSIYNTDNKQKLEDSELCKAGTVAPSWKAVCSWPLKQGKGKALAGIKVQLSF